MAKRFKDKSILNDNESVVLRPFMTRDLKLKGNELIAYAVIYGFSQDGATGFSGSRRYIADWMGADSLRTVDSCIGKLIDKGLIEYDGTEYICAYEAVDSNE